MRLYVLGHTMNAVGEIAALFAQTAQYPKILLIAIP